MFRLCLALGWPHPDYLGEVLSLEQVYEWMEFYSREPWGFDVEDQRSALQAMVVARSAGNKSARFDQFLMKKKNNDHKAATSPETPEQLKQRLRSAFGVPAPP